MLSNAAPLWKLLPEGALKRQILGALAERSQLGEHDLLELWGIAAPAPKAGPRERKSKGAESPYKRRAYGTGTRHAIAMAEHIARAILRNSESWDLLTNDDHHVLCELPSPHGDLFSWIDTRFHEHGAEPWAVLQLGIEGLPFADLAGRLVTLDDMQPSGRAYEVEEIGPDAVRRSMTSIHLDAIAGEIDRVGKLPGTDPTRMERLYELSRKRQALQEAQKPQAKS